MAASKTNKKQAASHGKVVGTLSRYMAAALKADLPAAVIEKAKEHILDTLAAAISGSQLPPGRVAAKFAREQGGRKEAALLGTRALVPAIAAALVNGMAAHADETDDSHAPSLSHPGCGVVPAALAIAEMRESKGLDFIKAVALGYDVGTRILMTLGVETTIRENHRSPHTIVSGFGAHAAAAALLRLDARQMRWVLTYAAQQASGTAAWQRDVDHIQKAFDFGGGPARNGVASALMVESGFTAVDDIFSGEHNFFQAFSPKADPKGLIAKLGQRYEITRTNIKKYAVGSPVQAPLDSLDYLLKQQRIRADEIATISVRVAEREARVVDNRTMPDICLQHLMAVMLVDGALGFAAAHDYDRMRDPKVLAQRRKITLIPDDALQAVLPRRQAILEVTTRRGQTLRHKTLDVRGTAQNPMSRDEIIAKCMDLLPPVLGKDKSRRLCDSVLNLEKLKNIQALRTLYQP